MCGRYYVDDDTAREIQRLIRDVEQKLQVSSGDIHPTEKAPVLVSAAGKLQCEWKKWGFPGVAAGPLVINARSESALEKWMFRDSVRQRRIVIPAAGFYEWNRRKEKNTFTRKDRPVLYMAGIYNRYENEDRFVILTTAANESMAPVHDRMPLILEEGEIQSWLAEEEQTEQILKKVPGLLERRTEYEQMSLF